MSDEEKTTPGLVPQPVPVPQPIPVPSVVLPPLVETSRIDGKPWRNPTPPYDTSDPNWPSKVTGGHTFTGSPPYIYEWISVLDPTAEQVFGVGITGTVVNPGPSTTDNPLMGHAFSTDFEFTIAPDSDYTNLVTNSANQRGGHYQTDFEAAQSAGIAVPAGTGLLGIEVEGALVPDGYRPNQGDSIAAYVEWIVDAGHSDGRLEGHPPQCYAFAKSVDKSGNITPRSENAITHCTFWSLPCMESQLFTTNGDKNLALEDYCKRISETLGDVQFYYTLFPAPFQGIYIYSFTVSPPVRRPGPGWQVMADYHITTNNSCAIEMIPSPVEPDSLLVIVTLNAVGYPALPHPSGHFVEYSVQDLLNQAPSGVNLDWLETLWVEWVNQVVYVYQFDAPQTSKTQDTVNVRTCIPVRPGALPDGTATDDNQHFPFYGYVKLYWSPPAPNPD